MNATELLAMYERVADAPDAVGKLRSLVLDLALRGKLVAQDASDGSASDLLRQIIVERARLERSKLIRASKTVAVSDEAPFELPGQWRWSSLAEVGVLSPRNVADDGTNASFVPMTLISSEYGIANEHVVRPWRDIKTGYSHFAEGDVGLAKITPCFENGKSTVFQNLTGGLGSGTTELHVVRPILVVPRYVLLFLKSPFFVEGGIPKMTGTAGQKRVPLDYFAGAPFPLPPLAEQHRIVAKVDELMALCDQLEAARTEREAARDRLGAASLARLNAPDPDTFQADARFALNVLPALSARPDQVKQLRQTILNLAVRGKLVQQDPGHERAIDQLSRSFGVRRRLSTPAADLLALPTLWEWVDLGSLITTMDAGWSPQCEDHPRRDTRSWGVLKTTAVQSLSFDCLQHKELPTKLAPRPQHEARVGDILVTRAGPKHRVGVSCVVDTVEPRLMISDKLIRMRVLDGIAPRYIALCLNAGPTYSAIESAKSGMAVMQMNISQNKLQAVPIPLAPLDEQHRIVARVDELMGICDQLEASLANGSEARGRLLDALLREALEPSDIAAA